MNDIPAKCRNCGLIFSSGFYIRGGARLHGNVAQCPKCGGPGYVVEGTVRSTIDGRLQIDNAPPDTLQIMSELRTIFNRAKEEEDLKPEDLIAEVETVSPKLAETLRKRKGCTVYVILLVLSWVIGAISVGATVDFNKLLDQAWHLQKGQDPNFHDIEGVAIPEEAIVRKPAAAPTVAVNSRGIRSLPQQQVSAPANRQQRRQRKSQERRRARRAEQLARRGDKPSDD